MRVRIAHADHFALWFSNIKHMPRTPGRDDRSRCCSCSTLNRFTISFRGSSASVRVVARRGSTRRAKVPWPDVIPDRGLAVASSCRSAGAAGSDAGVIVVEHEHAGVVVVSPARHAFVAWAEIARDGCPCGSAGLLRRHRRVSPSHGRLLRCDEITTHSRRSGCQRSSQAMA